MPLRWAQVGSRLDPARYTIRTALRELERRGDPLREVLSESADVEALLEALAARAPQPEGAPPRGSRRKA
jgi:DNA primase